MDYSNVLKKYFKKLDFDISTDKITKIVNFFEIVSSFNKDVNILGTKEADNIFIRHVLDCVSIIELKKYFTYITLRDKNILDLGSGGGFPGIVLAIIFDSSNFFLVDRSQKKSYFLNDVVKILRLENVKILNTQAEVLSRDSKYRENMDYCLARAFANIYILLELIIPFAKINSNLFFYKSKKVYEEITLTKNIISDLGAKVVSVEQVNVPFLKEFRAIEVLEKVSETPSKYPRNLSIIKNLYIK